MKPLFPPLHSRSASLDIRGTCNRLPRARLLIAASLIAIPASHAQQSPDPVDSRQPDSNSTEQIVVVGERVYPVVDSLAPDTGDAVDTAELLRRLPGANLNANGQLTGIAQYRGLYGDRVAVSLDGLRTVTGGPNAMDAPLSYASPLLLDHLSLERGIASVSSATESLGGHISVDHDRGRHGRRNDFSLSGKAQTRYASNGGLNSTAIQLVGANTQHKIAFLGQHDHAGDLDFPDGALTPTRLERDRYDLSYAWRQDGTDALVYAGRLDTTDTGTPSLPMDIRTIATDLYGVRLAQRFGADSTLEVAASYSDVDHIMDNFGLRPAPASPMSYRSTQAIGEGWQWRIGSRTVRAGTTWRFGIDGESVEHTATITNPNVAPFRIQNFSNAERDIVGVYGQWNSEHGPIDIETGLRVNRVTTNAGTVTATIPAMNPMMEMMGTAAATLAAGFNSGARDRRHTNVDAVVKIGRKIGELRNIYVEFGRKTRAPSYQELYLWLPLQATGGLADGRSYIGDPALDSEVSREINLGSNWQTRKTWLAPQLFLKDIDGYIQGIPSTNMTANTLSTMMTGSPALQFARTDAEVYGIDVAWGYYLTETLVIDGALTHVRGRRTDVDDELYRLAPLNGRVALTHEGENWSARLEAVVYAGQDDVARFNEEPPTAGYAVVNVSAQWQVNPAMLLTATALNLLDRKYQDHLDGINRVTGVDVPLGVRVYGPGRSLQVGLRFSW